MLTHRVCITAACAVLLSSFAHAAVTAIPTTGFTSAARNITFETIPLSTGVRFEFALGRDGVLFEGVPVSDPSSRPITLSDSSVGKPRAGEPGASAAALQNAAGTDLRLSFVSPMNRVGFQFRRTNATGDDDLLVTLWANGVSVGTFSDATVNDSYKFIGIESTIVFDQVTIDAFGTGNGRFNIDSLRFEGPTECRISNIVHSSATYVAVDPLDPNTLGAFPIGDEAFQWIGSRFTVSEATTISAVGAHLNGNADFGDGRIFAAIVQLAGPAALPPAIPGDPNNPFVPGDALNPSAIVASVEFKPPDFGPNAGDDVRVPLSATLAAGTYAVVFGSGDLDGDEVFDTSGDAGFPITGAPPVGTSILVWGLTFTPLDPNDPNSPGTFEYAWQDFGTFSTVAPRLFVEGVGRVVEVTGASTAFQLDAGGTRDPDSPPGLTSGTPNGLTFLWTSSCPGVMFSDPSSATPTLTVDTSAGVCPAGLTCTATVTITDSAGSCSASTTILIDDRTPPDLAVPAAFVGVCGGDTNPGVTGSATSSDPSAIVAFSDAPGSSIDPCTSVIERTWTATDACGNVTTGLQLVSLADESGPAFVEAAFPADATLECTEDTSVAALGMASATDDCGAVTIDNADVTTPGACGGSWVIARTWTAEDSCGNLTQRVQTITVVDSTPPAFASFPGAASINCGTPTSPANTGGPPTANDNCDPSPAVTYSDSVTPGACAGSYQIARTWVAADACGNSVSQVQVIDVVDATPPTFSSLPANVTLECGDDTSTDSTGLALATDNCATTVPLSYLDVESTTSLTCPVVAVITRTWIASDGCNTATYDQTITLVDTTAPTIGCPAGIQVTASPGQCFVSGLNLGTPTAADCSEFTLTNNAPSVFPVGETIVVWRATDICGQFTECQQTVTVEDTQPPAIVASVTKTMLWPANHDLINVGLNIDILDLCDSGVPAVVRVYSNEDDQWWSGTGFFSPDAKNIAEATLRLRAERSGIGIGRVYLIVVEATDNSGNSSETTLTVIVPHSRSNAAMWLISQLAQVTQIWYAAFGCPPPGFELVGDGPIIGPKQ